jgi:hypothetical protein
LNKLLDLGWTYEDIAFMVNQQPLPRIKVIGYNVGESTRPSIFLISTAAFTVLWRAVSPEESNSIISTGKFSVRPGTYEGKYFSTSEKGARWYAEEYGTRNNPWDIYKTRLSNNYLRGEMIFTDVDAGIDGIVVPYYRLGMMPPEFMYRWP